MDLAFFDDPDESKADAIVDATTLMARIDQLPNTVPDAKRLRIADWLQRRR